jgi:hypothetical protein
LKATGVVCLSLLSGIVGGIVSHLFFTPSTVPSSEPFSHEIHLSNNSSECDLTSSGLRIKWKDGREVWLDGSGLQMSTAQHHLKLAASDLKEINASYLVLDGRVWHAPSTRKKLDLVVGLAAAGEINPDNVENHQPN